MNRRDHRAAFQAKRTLPPDDLTDEQRAQIDAAWDWQKHDPAAQREQMRRDIQDQQQMLRILGSAL